MHNQNMHNEQAFLADAPRSATVFLAFGRASFVGQRGARVTGTRI
jgi:hypothetical protein